MPGRRPLRRKPRQADGQHLPVGQVLAVIGAAGQPGLGTQLLFIDISTSMAQSVYDRAGPAPTGPGQRPAIERPITAIPIKEKAIAGRDRETARALPIDGAAVPCHMLYPSGTAEASHNAAEPAKYNSTCPMSAGRRQSLSQDSAADLGGRQEGKAATVRDHGVVLCHLLLAESKLLQPQLLLVRCRVAPPTQTDRHVSFITFGKKAGFLRWG